MTAHNLLLLDDEANVLAGLKRVLRKEGYGLFTATSGRDGLAVLEGETISLVISDQKMPEMDGAEFLHTVKKRYPNVMRIMLTGQTDIAVANEWKYVSDILDDFDKNLPMVPCRGNEIGQVVLNLIINAAQAIGSIKGDGTQEKGTIKISTRLDGGFAEIRIQDNGPGIPKEIREKVFDPFFTTKGVGLGTGQGLTMAYSIIAVNHKGTITFDTEMGKGTTFIIRLPLNIDPMPAGAA